MESKKIGAAKTDILEFAKERLNAEPEYLWQKFPDYAVLRRTDNKKWYAVIGAVEYSKLGFKMTGKTDVLVVKSRPQEREILLHEQGIIPAYHMNKEHWISCLLDGTARKELVFGLLEESFDLALNKKRIKHNI